MFFFHKPSRIFCGSVFLSRSRPEAVLVLLHWEENACKCPLCSATAPGHCTVFSLGLCMPINIALRKKLYRIALTWRILLFHVFFPYVSYGPGITPTGVPLWEWPTLKMYCSREELIRGKWFMVSLFSQRVGITPVVAVTALGGSGGDPVWPQRLFRLFSASGSGTIFIQGHSSFKYWVTSQVLRYAYFLGGLSFRWQNLLIKGSDLL